MASRDADISTNITGREPTEPMYVQFMSLQEEADNEGWTRTTRPVGGQPPNATTLGTAGANSEKAGDPDSPAAGYELPGVHY